MPLRESNDCMLSPVVPAAACHCARAVLVGATTPTNITNANMNAEQDGAEMRAGAITGWVMLFLW
jgi:hypothetical protein